jgi:ammonia channel protein AmtB
LPLLAEGDERAAVAVATTIVALAVGAISARAAVRQVPRPRWAPIGVVLVAVAAVLIAVTPRGVLHVLVAVVGGTR